MAWTADAPKGRLLLVHGLGEHGGRYGEFARALARRGYSVLAYDQRGHGRSEGARAHTSTFDLLVADLEGAAEVAATTLAGSGAPFLFGQSMGALVLLRHLQTGRPSSPGAILSAPWLGLASPVPRWKTALAVLLRLSAPSRLVPTALEPEKLTSDGALQLRYREDPLIVHGISVGLYDAVRGAQEEALTFDRPLSVPVLVLLPLADRVVDGACTEAWAVRAGPGVELRRLPGLLHEPHNEPNREDVFSLIADWMDSRTLRTRDG
jgi:alpha-beta hydrolase superfamily lysophospholipase